MRTVDPIRHAARRTQILGGAATVFAAKGFDHATVKDICAAAGVGSGTLFHYFADKRAILHALLEVDREAAVAALAAETESDRRAQPTDAVAAEAAFWAVVERLTAELADPTAGGIVLAILGQLAVDPVVVELLVATDQANQEVLGRRIEALQLAGAADPDWPAADAARWVQTVVDGLYLRCGDDEFDAAAELARLRLVLSRMLGMGTGMGGD